MASVPVVLFFKGADGYGWSERFYMTPSSGDFTLSPGDVVTLCNKRAALLTSSNSITHARIGTSVKRLVTLVTLNDGAGIPGTETPPSQASEVAIIVQSSVPGVGYNRTFIRGIPERVTQLDGYVPDATYKAEMDAFENLLRGGQFNIQGTLGSPDDQININTIATNKSRGFQFTPESPLPGDVGSQIRVHGCKVPGYNGIKTITDIGDGPAFRVTVGGASPPVDEPAGEQYVTQIVTFDQPVSAVNVVGLSRRAAGRPFGLSRGRRPTLYSLRQ